MTLIIKSDAVYTGTGSLPTLASLVYTAAKYKARVLADGGEIINSSAVDAAFAFLAANGVPARQFVVGASFGIKRSGASIDKLYSFDGNDMIRLANGDVGVDPVLDTTTYGYPVVEQTAVTTLNNLRTKLLARVQSGDGYCFAQSARDNGADSRYPTFAGYYPNGVNVQPVGIIPFNGDDAMSMYWGVAPKAAYTPGALQSATVASIKLEGAPYAAWDGVSFHMTQSTGVCNLYVNGALKTTGTAVGGLLDLRDQQLYIAHSYIEEINGTKYQYKNNQFTELWNVKDCSPAFALALSQRLADLY